MFGFQGLDPQTQKGWYLHALFSASLTSQPFNLLSQGRDLCFVLL